MQDQRLHLLQDWLNSILTKQSFSIIPITGDASFRRYFRIQLPNQTFIAMDAPPEKEDCRPFIAIAKAFAQLGVQVPTIYFFDLTQGFLLLADFGDRLLANELTSTNVEALYTSALNVLPKIHKCQRVNDWTLPHFGRDFILREWHLHQQWHIEKHWNLELNVHEQHIFTDTFELLVHSAINQPQVCVHRDYHSRNLLCLNNNSVGILDFQDAVWGPITYDAVSLLRDSYIDWPIEITIKMINYYYDHSREHAQLKNVSLDEFIRWFDLMGIQRNLKAIGIFARLKHLYQRPNYLQYIPRALNYVMQVSSNYPELNAFRNFLQQSAIPQLQEANL